MMEWKELQQDKAKLCELLNKYSRSQIDNELDLEVSGRQVQRWAKKNGIYYDHEDKEWYIEPILADEVDEPIKKEIEEDLYDYVEDEESDKIEIDEYETYYHIYNTKKEESISKHKLEKIYEWYCEDGLTQDETWTKAKLEPEQFKFIRKAFGFVHKSIPHPDHKFREQSIEQIVDETLARKKEKYQNLYNIKELRRLKEIEKKYEQKRYFYEKTKEEIAVPIRPLNFNVNVIDGSTEGVLVLGDWHTGLKVTNYWNRYSIAIQQNRLADMACRVMTYIRRHKVKTVHILQLGDLIHGIIHVSTRVVSETDVIQQFRLAWQFLAELIGRISKETEVKFYNTYGNHARVTEKKTDAVDRENFERLFPDILKEHFQQYNHVHFMENEYDEQIIVAKPCNHVIFGVHGDRDKNKKVAENLTMMMDMKPYKIYTAHGHHFEQLETHGVDVIMNRALCGVDDFSKDIRKTARAGQSFHVYNPAELEVKYDMEFN